MANRWIQKAAAILLAALCLAPAMTSCRAHIAIRNAASSELWITPDSTGVSAALASAPSLPIPGGSAPKSASVLASAVPGRADAGKTDSTLLGINPGGDEIPVQGVPPITGGLPVASSASSPLRNYSRVGLVGVDGSFTDSRPKETISDLGGKAYTLATAWPEMYDGNGNTADDKLGAQAVASIQKDYNCRLAIKMLDTSGGEILRDKASGVAYADILDSNSLGGNQNFLYGAAADLSKVTALNLRGKDNNNWNMAMCLASSLPYKTFSVGLRYDWIERDVLYFNRTLAARYGLGNFYDTLNAGSWTEDQFIKICQTAKKNGGGQYAACTAIGPSRLDDLLYTAWMSPFGYTSTRYLYIGTDQSVRNIFSTLRTFVSDGLFDKTYDKADWKTDGTFEDSAADLTRSSDEFKAGKALFYLGSSSQLQDFHDTCKIAYGLLPLPKGPMAGGYSSVVTDCRVFSLVDGDPEIDNSAALLTALADRTDITTTVFSTRERALVPDDDSLNTLIANNKNKQLFSVQLCPSGNLPAIFNGAFVSSVIDQTKTVDDAVGGIASKAQAEIDKVCGQ